MTTLGKFMIGFAAAGVLATLSIALRAHGETPPQKMPAVVQPQPQIEETFAKPQPQQPDEEEAHGS